MSLIKGKREVNTILDFSDPNISKNKIKEAVRFLKIVNVTVGKDNLTIFDNFVKVGSYNIKLVLQENYDNTPKKLSEYGKFQIRIFENNKEIKLQNDYRFKKQNWIKLNICHNLKIKYLIETIIYCQRLNNIKAFL